MKTCLTLATTLLLAAPALAHPGHDHSGAPGGEHHHLLWLGLVAVIAVAGTVTLLARRRQR